MLEIESGLQIQSLNVKQLFIAIYESNYDLCFNYIKMIKFTIDTIKIENMFLELMFIEMILKKDTKSALNLLRNELQSSIHDKTRIKTLSSCLLCFDEDQISKICKGYNIITSKNILIDELKKYISTSQVSN